jgi:hypothetical protein
MRERKLPDVGEEINEVAHPITALFLFSPNERIRGYNIRHRIDRAGIGQFPDRHRFHMGQVRDPARHVVRSLNTDRINTPPSQPSSPDPRKSPEGKCPGKRRRK